MSEAGRPVRAVTFDHYTGIDGLSVTETPEPEASDGRVVVEVAAAGLNPFDWHMYRGEPWVMRGSAGWRVTSPRVVGADLAGVVVAVGAGVESFSAGDRVFGSIGHGALAERASAPASALAPIPAGVTMTDAAALPMAGLTALQALRDAGELQPGERVLVWGASGGVGHLAVQIARVLGAARVEAMCSRANADFVRGLGADEVHDYAAAADPRGPYDVVIDMAATRSVRRLRPALAEGGRIVTIGSISRGRVLGPASALLTRTVAGRLQRVRTTGIFASVTAADLALLAQWLGEGRVRPAVQEVIPFDRYSEALRKLEAGHVRGKLVVALRG